MLETFSTFLSQLSETNATLDYYVDFEKVNANIRKIDLKLNQLNFLIGKEDLETAVNDFCSKRKIMTNFTKRTLVEYLFDNYIYFAHHNHQILMGEDGKYYNYTEKGSIHYVRDIMYEIFAFSFSFKEDNRSVLESLEFKFINDSKIYKVI